jgi:hypothetical protein
MFRPRLEHRLLSLGVQELSICMEGQYNGHVEGCTIIEAVALYDLWIWHSFFSMTSFHNYINMLHRSLVFDRLLEGTIVVVNYEINVNAYGSHTILLMASRLTESHCEDSLQT